MSIPWGELDPGVVSIVGYFNDHGLPTVMSCEGHDKTKMSMLWIQFDDSVTEDDIINFQLKHTDPYWDSFASCGRLVQRVYWGGTSVVKTWQYMAATKEAAAFDLKYWMERDRNR